VYAAVEATNVPDVLVPSYHLYEYVGVGVIPDADAVNVWPAHRFPDTDTVPSDNDAATVVMVSDHVLVVYPASVAVATTVYVVPVATASPMV
jgi:hypothetical protein